jgi:hypothetical protein
VLKQTALEYIFELTSHDIKNLPLGEKFVAKSRIPFQSALGAEPIAQSASPSNPLAQKLNSTAYSQR